MNASLLKRRFPLLPLCLALLLAQGVLHALTPGPTVIWQCPGCKAALRELTMGSGNTMGAKFWTDGKCEAPMMLFRYPAAKCAQCSHVFILETATQLDQIGWDTDREKKEKKWKGAPALAKPTEAELLSLAERPKLTSPQQITARRLAWWLANDRARHDPTLTTNSFSGPQLRNLKSLLPLLDDKDPGQRLTKAELARELNDFDTSASLLAASGITNSGMKRTADFIRELVSRKDPVVRQIPAEPRQK